MPQIVDLTKNLPDDETSESLMDLGGLKLDTKKKREKVINMLHDWILKIQPDSSLDELITAGN